MTWKWSSIYLCQQIENYTIGLRGPRPSSVIYLVGKICSYSVE